MPSHYFIEIHKPYIMHHSQTWFNISGTKPSVGNPMGNPGYPGWTACAGGNGECSYTKPYYIKVATSPFKCPTGLV